MRVGGIPGSEKSMSKTMSFVYLNQMIWDVEGFDSSLYRLHYLIRQHPDQRGFCQNVACRASVEDLPANLGDL